MDRKDVANARLQGVCPNYYDLLVLDWGHLNFLQYLVWRNPPSFFYFGPDEKNDAHDNTGEYQFFVS